MKYVDPRPVELVTPRLVLRNFVMEDVARVAEIANDPRVADTVLSIAMPYEVSHAEEFWKKQDVWWREGKAFVFAIAKRGVEGSEGIVGFTGLHVRGADDSAELGYWLGHAYWNLGYATEAARAICEWGFATRGLHRIFAHHMANNPASGRVMEKLGMQHEGLLREHVKKGSEYRDVHVFGVLKRHWELGTGH
jgi:ribosomal-protein-alanine N-acetyltransferase